MRRLCVLSLGLAIVACGKSDPSSSAPPKPTFDAPPTDHPSIERIPPDPVQGVFEGVPAKGVLKTEFWLLDAMHGQLYLTFTDSPITGDICKAKVTNNWVNLQLGKTGYEVGKPFIHPIGPKIDRDKVYAAFGDEKANVASNPAYDEVAYAFQIDKLEPPKDRDTPGKIKIRLAVLIKQPKVTWMTGTYDGILCAW